MASSRYDEADLPGSVFLISSDGKMLRLPIPSESPNDPLAWNKRKRSLAKACLTLFYVAGIVTVMAPASELRAFAGDKDLSDRRPFTMDVLVTAPTLMLGIGAFIWVPLSLALGRRPVFIFCSILLTLATVWAAAAQTFHQLLGAVCLQGLASGSVLSLVLCIVIDMTFIHERPQAIAQFWAIPNLFNLLVISTVPEIIGTDINWRPFYRIWSIVCFATSVIMILFCPETFFHRPPVAYDGRVLVQTGAEKVHIYEDWDEVPGGKMTPNAPAKTRLQRILNRLRFWGNQPGEWRSTAACYPQIVLCLCNPLVFWTTLLNAANFGGMMSIGGSFAFVLRSPPYNFPSHIIALVNLASAAGGLLAWPHSVLIAKITRRLTMRNAGLRHAEYYLPNFILPVLTGAASCALYGLTAEHKWHWIWIYVAYGLNGFSYSASGAANTIWVTEAFPQWAAPALVVVGGFSYVVSFAMISYVLPRWLAAQGYAKTNLEIAGLILAAGGIGLPIAFWGKKVRQYLHGHWSAFEAGALRPQ